MGALLGTTGERLLDLDPAAAEPVLRECAGVWEKLAPGTFLPAHSRALLGGSLVHQGRAAEAEPLLRTGYAGMRADLNRMPPDGRTILPTTADRLARASLALGKPDEAARWRAERANYPPEVAPRPRPVLPVAPFPREPSR